MPHPARGRGGEFFIPRGPITGFGKSLHREPPAYSVIEVAGQQELVWWDGADFRIPVTQRSPSWIASTPVLLLEVLEPYKLRGVDSHRLPRVPEAGDSLELRCASPMKLSTFLWLSSDPPGVDALRAVPGELWMDRRALRMGSTDRGLVLRVRPPPHGSGLLLEDMDTSRKAYVPRAQWAGVVDLDSLEWH